MVVEREGQLAILHWAGESFAWREQLWPIVDLWQGRARASQLALPPMKQRLQWRNGGDFAPWGGTKENLACCPGVAESFAWCGEAWKHRTCGQAWVFGREERERRKLRGSGSNIGHSGETTKTSHSWGGAKESLASCTGGERASHGVCQIL